MCQSYYTEQLAQQANEVVEQYWDYHPTPALPEGLLLCAYEDGIWICDPMGECNMFKFKRIERITEATWGND